MHIIQHVLTHAGGGHAIIPLNGKVPALRWKPYQTRYPSAEQLQTWFTGNHAHTAYGVVTGRLSNLIVVEFDDDDIWSLFVREFPHLCRTHTVRSAGRGLPHLYFAPPQGANLRSLNGHGVELKANGRYVVGTGSDVSGKRYRTINDAPPRQLLPGEFAGVRQFVVATKPHTRTDLRDSAFRDGHEALSRLHSQFKSQQRQQVGRNEALFYTAIWARDHGLSQSTVEQHLLESFVRLSGSTAEPAHLRRAEGQHTIDSAYSRPPSGLSESTVTPNMVPNTIREALLQRKQTAVLRVLECLVMHNLTTFTRDQCLQLCHNHNIGRYSVDTFLRSARDMLRILSQ